MLNIQGAEETYQVRPTPKILGSMSRRVVWTTYTVATAQDTGMWRESKKSVNKKEMKAGPICSGPAHF